MPPLSNLQIVAAVYTLIFGVMAVVQIVLPVNGTGSINQAGPPAPAPKAAKQEEGVLGGIANAFAGNRRITIKAYIVQANKEVVYLPHVAVRFARAAEVEQIVDEEEAAIKKKQEELDTQAGPLLDLLTKYNKSKQERNADEVKTKLRLLSKEWKATNSPQRVFGRLPTPEVTIKTDDKGRATAELPAGDWYCWADSNRFVAGTNEEYQWLQPVPKSNEVVLAHDNLYKKLWQRDAAWSNLVD